MPISDGAAIGIAAGSSALNVAGGLFGAKQNYKYTKKLQNAQNAYNTDMWNKTNEYNKPINQVARLREAGINPALAASNGQIQNSASSAPQASEQSFNGFPSFNTGSDFMSALQTTNQMNLASSQAGNLDMDTALKAIDKYVNEHTKDNKIEASNVSLKGLKLANDVTVKTLDTIGLQQDTLRKQLVSQNIHNAMDNYTFSQMPIMMRSEYEKNFASAYQSLSAGQLNEEQMKEVLAKCVCLYAQAENYKHLNKFYDSSSAKNYSDISLNNHIASYYDASAFNLQQQGLSTKYTREHGYLDPLLTHRYDRETGKILQNNQTNNQLTIMSKQFKYHVMDPSTWMNGLSNMATAASSFISPIKLGSPQIPQWNQGGFGTPNTTYPW